ncbi:hypothetical protein Dimus_006118 [Dionaea muscipula]
MENDDTIQEFPIEFPNPNFNLPQLDADLGHEVPNSIDATAHIEPYGDSDLPTHSKDLPSSSAPNVPEINGMDSTSVSSTHFWHPRPRRKKNSWKRVPVPIPQHPKTSVNPPASTTEPTQQFDAELVAQDSIGPQAKIEHPSELDDTSLSVLNPILSTAEPLNRNLSSNDTPEIEPHEFQRVQHRRHRKTRGHNSNPEHHQDKPGAHPST